MCKTTTIIADLADGIHGNFINFSIGSDNNVLTAILMTIFFGIIIAVIGKPFFVYEKNLSPRSGRKDQLWYHRKSH